jgi:glycosyltransferase involved in cell wall biosynthesis
MKLLAVNIAFRSDHIYKRWRLFSEMDEDIEVILVGPKYYEYGQIGPPIKFEPRAITEPNFRVRHVDMHRKRYLLNDWLSREYFRILKEENPDIIYLIGHEISLIAIQTELFRKLYKPNAKIALFTMMGIDMPTHKKDVRFLTKAMYAIKWNINKRIYDFVCVHYPNGKQVVKEQGKYMRPVYLQTQVGVDHDVYRPSAARRDSIRNRYNIGNNIYVFCSAIRIEEQKGVFDIIEACKRIDAHFKFFLLGNGKDYEKVKRIIQNDGLDDRIILTNLVPTGEDVAAFMNAADCFIHVPRTDKTWVDTFPLAVVQAMACGLPVIGSDSGAIPYQLGEDGMIIEEGNHRQLADMMIGVMQDKQNSVKNGHLMLKRVLERFEIRILNKIFYRTIKAHVK